MTKKEKI